MGIWNWYRKTPKERCEIVVRDEMEKTVRSLVDYYSGLGELSRAMTRIRGDD